MKAKVSIRYDPGGEVVADRRFGTDGSSGGATKSAGSTPDGGPLWKRVYLFKGKI